jgi:hypothetical protein
MLRQFRTAFTSVMVATTACGGEGPTTAAPELCQDGVTMSVEPTTRPTFSWTPQCGVKMLEVVEVATQDGLRWVIVANPSLIAPPVRYGLRPDGVQGVSARELVVGRTYRASVFMATGTFAPAIGSVTFIAR